MLPVLLHPWPHLNQNPNKHLHFSKGNCWSTSAVALRSQLPECSELNPAFSVSNHIFLAHSPHSSCLKFYNCKLRQVGNTDFQLETDKPPSSLKIYFVLIKSCCIQHHLNYNETAKKFHIGKGFLRVYFSNCWRLKITFSSNKLVETVTGLKS